MRKLIIFLIAFLIYRQESFSEALNFDTFEKNIFTDNQTVRVKKWRKIRNINTLISSLKARINWLSIVTNVTDPDGKNYELQKYPLGLRNDPIRVKMKLQIAQDHLYLGDQLNAISIVNKVLENIDPRNKKYLSWAYEILFESNRQIKNHDQTTSICLKMLFIGGYQEDIFSEKWKFSCSIEFLNEVKNLKRNGNIEKIKNSLIIWANSPVFKKDSKYKPINAIFIALSFREIYSNNDYSIHFIEDAIGNTNIDNYYIGRAYLVISLLKYEKGNRSDTLSLLRFLTEDYKEYGKYLKYFKNDNITRQIAKLCLARFHASMTNFEAALTWYNDLILQENISNLNFLKKEKIKVHLEYAYVLYLTKRYIDSANEYKKLIRENFIENFNINFEKDKKIKVTNFTLAKLFSKISSNKYENETKILELLAQTETDIKYLNKIKQNNINSNIDNFENILVLADLAEEYGVKNNIINKLLLFKNLFTNYDKKLYNLRVDLANAINVADYYYSGIFEARAVSSLTQLSQIMSEFKNILILLDSLEFNEWNFELSGVDFAKKNRLELLNRFNSMEDDIYNYKMKEKIEKEISNIKNYDGLKNIYNNLNKINSEMNGVNFLFMMNGSKIPDNVNNKSIDFLEESYAKKEFNDIYQEIIKLFISERKYKISKKLIPLSMYIFQNKSDIFEKTMIKLHEIHKNHVKKSTLIGDIKLRNEMNDAWSNLIASYKFLLLSLFNINNNINLERREIINEINNINDQIIKEEKDSEHIKNQVLFEYKNISKEIILKLEPKLNEFKSYVKILLSENYKEIYDSKIENDNEIIKFSKERENWLNTLSKSINMDLLR